MTIKITKQLATMEDLAIGTGTVVQERNGIPLTLNKINFTFNVTNVAAMQALQTVVGTVIRTLGYYSAGDSGGANYIVSAGDTSNGFNKILVGGNTAVLVREQPIRAAQLGAVSGEDSTEALQSFFDLGEEIHVEDNATYIFSSLVWDTPFILTGNGVLRYSGAAAPIGTAAITGAAAIKADNVSITSAGIGDLAFNLIELTGDGVEIGKLSMKSDAQRDTTGGSKFNGSSIKIGYVEAVNVARPIECSPISGTTIRTAIEIGEVVIQNYIRGVKLAYVNFFKVGNINARTRWGGATAIPGYNAVLTEVCNNYEFGTIYAENAAEHSVRIGGAGNSGNFKYGDIFVKDGGGCAFKSNPDSGFTSLNGTVASITSVNIGEKSVLGNKEAVRLSKTHNLTIGQISVYEGCTRALALAEVSNIVIGELFAEEVLARVISCVDGQDGTTGPIDGVFINNIVAKLDSGARSAYELAYANGIGNFYINASYTTGYNSYLANFIGAVINAPILISARVETSDPSPFIENVVDTDFLQLDVKQGLNRYVGKAVDMDLGSIRGTSDPESFDPSSSPTHKGTYFINSASLTPGLGAYGGSIAFSRLGSSRRGAAIASKQITSDNKHVGLAFFVQNSGTSGTESVYERMVLKHTGTLNLNNMETSPSNLVAGDIWNNAGVLNIV